MRNKQIFDIIIGKMQRKLWDCQGRKDTDTKKRRQTNDEDTKRVT